MRLFPSIAALVAATSLLAPGAALAQEQLKLDQVGAALVFPLWGGSIDDREFGPAVTYISITNVGPKDRNLHFSAITDRNDCSVIDFDCPVTANETVLVTYDNQTDLLTMECNFGGQAPGGVIVKRLNQGGGPNTDDGVLLVTNETHECKDGTCTTNANDLFGDFVMVKPDAGFAWSGGAIPFQGINPLAPGVSDRDYHFDNDEYAMFPATLATNFIAPGPNPALGGAYVTADLFLFSLDFRPQLRPQASYDIVFYDDDETPTSTHDDHRCTSTQSLTDIDPNFAAPLLGSDAGHLYLTALDTDQESNAHDNKFGNGNSIRVIGSHGWLYQSVLSPNSGAAWVRTLAQGMLPQDVDGTDVPTFDGL